MSGTMDKKISGPPHVHHMDAPTAYQSAKLGMWLFLATEVLLFGGLFTAFAIFRYVYLDEYAAASTHLDWRMGAINTVFLIFSSFTAVLAVDAAQHGNNAKVRKNLLITMGCGLVFLVVKYFEYKSKYHHGLFPGNFGLFLFVGATFIALGFFFTSYFMKFKKPLGIVILIALPLAFWFLKDTLTNLHFDLASILPFDHKEQGDMHYDFNSPEFSASFKSFFGLYYCMTGLHALHVILGMGILFWVYIKASSDRFSSDYYTPVEVGALYWHLVDLIWIYLFPLLYLVG